MRKRKLMAAVMTLVMTACIYSPVQAAGYCDNVNGNSCQIIVGGNCQDSDCQGGVSADKILNSINFNNGSSVKGAQDNSNYNNGNVNKIVIGGSCGNESSCLPSAIQKYISDGNSCGNSCGTQAAGKTGTKYGNVCQSATDSENACKPSNASGSSCRSAEQNAAQGKATDKQSAKTPSSCNVEQSSAKAPSSCNAGQTSAKTPSSCNAGRQSTKAPSSCNTGQKSTRASTTEKGTTEQPTTEKGTTEQSATGKEATEQLPENTSGQPVTDKPKADQEKTTEENNNAADDNNAADKSSDKTEKADVTAGMNEEQATVAGQVLDIVNQNRSASGLHSLKLDSELCAAAQIRANEIVTSFSHTRPDGRKFSTVLTDNGIRFTAAGENIAWGQRSPEEVMDAWMGSDGHRANIMNAGYTKLGVGHVTVNGRQYWVQLFSY